MVIFIWKPKVCVSMAPERYNSCRQHTFLDSGDSLDCDPGHVTGTEYSSSQSFVQLHNRVSTSFRALCQNADTATADNRSYKGDNPHQSQVLVPNPFKSFTNRGFYVAFSFGFAVTSCSCLCDSNGLPAVQACSQRHCTEIHRIWVRRHEALHTIHMDSVREITGGKHVSNSGHMEI